MSSETWNHVSHFRQRPTRFSFVCFGGRMSSRFEKGYVSSSTVTMTASSFIPIGNNPRNPDSRTSPKDNIRRYSFRTRRAGPASCVLHPMERLGKEAAVRSSGLEGQGSPHDPVRAVVDVAHAEAAYSGLSARLRT